MSDTLEQVLADAREEARTLMRHTPSRAIGEAVLDLCDRVQASAEDWLHFAPESEAMLRTGFGSAWLRQRYAAWEAQGHARKVGGTRYYRAAVLPQRVPASIAREQGRRGERRRSA